MSDPEYVTTPVVVFRSPSVNLSVAIHGPKGGPNQHIYQITKLDTSPAGTPRGTLTLPDLLALRALVDEAVRSAITSAALVPTVPNPPNAPRKNG
jgi:hypothetical protein